MPPYHVFFDREYLWCWSPLRCLNFLKLVKKTTIELGTLLTQHLKHSNCQASLHLTCLLRFTGGSSAGSFPFPVFKLFTVDLVVCELLWLCSKIVGTNAALELTSDFRPPVKCTEHKRVFSVGVKPLRRILFNQSFLRTDFFGIR